MPADATDPRRAELAGRIAKLEEVADEARAARSYSAAVNALARLASLDSDLARMRDLEAAEGASLADELAIKRRIAEREGSWVAAGNLAKLEADYRARLAEAEAAKAAAEMTTLSEEELLGLVLGFVRDMPLDELAAIAEAVEARIGTTGPAAG